MVERVEEVERIDICLNLLNFLNHLNSLNEKCPSFEGHFLYQVLRVIIVPERFRIQPYRCTGVQLSPRKHL